jgi:hypothetical protein
MLIFSYLQNFSYPVIFTIYIRNLHCRTKLLYSIANPQMVLPPDVKMNYNGTEYDGKLISYKFRKTESFGQLDPLTKELSFRDVQNGELRDFTIKPNNIIKNLNFSLSESIKIENSSQVKSVITDSPTQLPPDSLSITAYNPNPTKAIKVLEVDERDPENSSFTISLDNKEKYLLMGTATWTSVSSEVNQNNNVTGYAIYVWPIYVQ